MEKIIENPFVFLDQEITTVQCRFIKEDSLKQSVLTCDLYTTIIVDDEPQKQLVYADKAYIVGAQPFELTEKEIEELKQWP